ncbi:MAG: acyl-CoA dehydrogenase [Microbacteriaceae bacterium]|nr:acyl-CoA dehydrogenase [Microbacteriaceae bacterium]
MTTDWQPTTEHRAGAVTAESARALHDLLDIESPTPQAGDPLPILWHWLAFLPEARQSDLGPDGHPRTGGFLPPVGDRVRMYAGGTVTRSGLVRIGEALAKTSGVTSVENKQGRSGDLLFVEVDSRLAGENGSLNEASNIVYKQPSPFRPGALDGDLVDGEWSSGREVSPDPAMLFRFSALTYNAHRIHYDRSYATEIEGYPGLVVHGPLQAILLADLLRSAVPSHTAESFRFRSTAPAFDIDPLQLRLRINADRSEAELAAFSGGRRTMTAKATLTHD